MEDRHDEAALLDGFKTLGVGAATVLALPPPPAGQPAATFESSAARFAHLGVAASLQDVRASKHTARAVVMDKGSNSRTLCTPSPFPPPPTAQVYDAPPLLKRALAQRLRLHTALLLPRDDPATASTLLEQHNVPTVYTPQVR